MILRTTFALGAVALGITAAVAQANVIEQRQAVMKQFNSAARTMAGMLRGQAPFDLAQVQNTLRTYSQNAKQAPSLFPENSKTGNDTRALPAVWENKADFNGLFAKFEQDATTALATIKDEASFKTEMPKVLQNCDSCHDKYRRRG